MASELECKLLAVELLLEQEELKAERDFQLKDL
jgi:hypothetical protein